MKNKIISLLVVVMVSMLSLAMVYASGNAPYFVNLPDEQYVEDGSTLVLDFTAIDPDGDPINYFGVNGPGKIDWANRKVTWKVDFNSNQIGSTYHPIYGSVKKAEYAFHIKSCSSNGMCDEVKKEIVVYIGEKRPPAVTMIPMNEYEMEYYPVYEIANNFEKPIYFFW